MPTGVRNGECRGPVDAHVAVYVDPRIWILESTVNVLTQRIEVCVQNRIRLLIIGFEEEEVFGLASVARGTVTGVTVHYVCDGGHKFGPVGCTSGAE